MLFSLKLIESLSTQC